jgi:hypothetical protein
MSHKAAVTGRRTARLEKSWRQVFGVERQVAANIAKLPELWKA